MQGHNVHQGNQGTTLGLRAEGDPTESKGGPPTNLAPALEHPKLTLRPCINVGYIWTERGLWPQSSLKSWCINKKIGCPLAWNKDVVWQAIKSLPNYKLAFIKSMDYIFNKFFFRLPILHRLKIILSRFCRWYYFSKPT